ncbi:uncharacterized protein LOC105392905 isoform X1 [Plutella xylostella]|uniref:uncharacterized protein LOC105392905 isoform X1 n=1 Tax=Plutella xylostella TaxID=51655 RepID=UPI00203271B9|nr:uncharacterized protein LOC105392905 isoform X1 [Plutella xylostella]
MKVEVCVVFSAFVLMHFCAGQYFGYRDLNAPPPPPLPFPPCLATDVACQRRGLRTFFYLMDAGHRGMRPVDPSYVNSVTVTQPERRASVVFRRLNVTGVGWTKLVERKFNLQDNRSGVKFLSNLHATGEIVVNLAERFNPLTALITLDISDVETNITYKWEGVRGIDNEDYLVIGQERIAARNSRVPTYFLQPEGEETNMIHEILQRNPSTLDHIGVEITMAVMYSVVDNFRLFAMSVPVRYYYQYYF